jgi:hypothetical protein
MQGYTSIGNDKIWLFPRSGDQRDSTITLLEGEQSHLSDWVTLKSARDFVGARAEVVTTAGRCYKTRVIDLFEEHSLGPDTWV